MNSSTLSTEPADGVATAAASRRSVRAFLPHSVDERMIEQILTTASHAPSGSNTQPWRVYVSLGNALVRLGNALQQAFLDDVPPRPEYEYYASPLPCRYLARRRDCGFGLYRTIGIERHDKASRKAYRSGNYIFFGAPVGMVFTIDRRLSIGSWLDYGMFLQTAMLQARALGLHTCAEGSIAEYPDILRRLLPIPDEEMIICGMALGYADPDAPINGFQPFRKPAQDFSVFVSR